VFLFVPQPELLVQWITRRVTARAHIIGPLDGQRPALYHYRETTAGCGVSESGISSRTNPKAGGNDAE
jgi:hypothetical protein